MNILTRIWLLTLFQFYPLHCVFSPSHDLYFLLQGGQLTVPSLNVKVEAVPELGPGGQPAHVGGDVGN